MEEKTFLTMDEVAEILTVSKSKAYEIVRQLNKELKAKGLITVSILVYSVCNSLMASEEGSVLVVQSGAVNALCISSNCRYNAFTVCTKGYIVSFLPTTQMRL